MWLFTLCGFYSIVQEPGRPHLRVRARVKEDLDQLRERYLPELGPARGQAGADYPWRAAVPRAALAQALGRIVMDIHYTGFRDEVAARQGLDRAARYQQVWGALHGLYAASAPAPAQPSSPWARQASRGVKVAYGGVVFGPGRQVLLREPSGHYHGYAWSFAKGRPLPAETPEATALREVEEEMGLQARIVAPIPGQFVAGTTLNRYFLMVPAEPGAELGGHDHETARIGWFSPEQARERISLTTNLKGRQRDLAVLEAALKALEALPEPGPG
jgi:8-oxo-dGTP pyrophosphatase MutT (NUDIX family)